MRIQDRFKAIPAPLQRQILRRGLMGCAFFLLSLIFLLLGYDAMLVLPGFGFMLFCMGSAMRLFYIADGNRYVVVEGICTEVRNGRSLSIGQRCESARNGAPGFCDFYACLL